MLKSLKYDLATGAASLLMPCPQYDCFGHDELMYGFRMIPLEVIECSVGTMCGRPKWQVRFGTLLNSHQMAEDVH